MNKKSQDLKNLSREELVQKEKALKEELHKLNVQRYTAQPEKPHMFSIVRKDIARVKTFLNEKKENSG